MKNTIQFTGEITFTAHEQKNPIARAFNEGLELFYKAGLISRSTLASYYLKGKPTRTFKKKNIIATAGLSVLAQILVGDYASTGAITHAALGTGVGTPAIGDTTLFNEVYRNDIASSSSFGATAILIAFYTESEVDGTFTEFGNFIDGTGVVDTGQLWSKITVAWTKSSAETLTVQQVYELTNKP